MTSHLVDRGAVRAHIGLGSRKFIILWQSLIHTLFLSWATNQSLKLESGRFNTVCGSQNRLKILFYVSYLFPVFLFCQNVEPEIPKLGEKKHVWCVTGSVRWGVLSDGPLSGRGLPGQGSAVCFRGQLLHCKTKDFLNSSFLHYTKIFIALVFVPQDKEPRTHLPSIFTIVIQTSENI